jgi:hypothetical protein
MNTTRAALIALLSTGLAAAASQGHSTGDDQEFIKQLYSDVLNRNDTRAERTQWVTFLENGGARIQIASALTSSQEYRKLLIDQVYSDYLGRVPAADEMNFWLAWLQQGATDDDLRTQVLASAEFFTQAGSTNAGFLNQLFLKVLGAPIDAVSLASLEQLLSQGKPRAAVAGLVLKSLAAEQREVDQWSVRFLHKNADPATLANYSTALQNGATDEQIIDLFLASDAYFALATHRN